MFVPGGDGLSDRQRAGVVEGAVAQVLEDVPAAVELRASRIQLTPSPPIWMSPSVSRSIQLAMKWQPMPASACEPSGTLVDVLCGQPEQK